jgi:hypothetical protein
MMEAKSERNWVLILAAGVAVVALCVLMALAGFTIGRATMAT